MLGPATDKTIGRTERLHVFPLPSRGGGDSGGVMKPSLLLLSFTLQLNGGTARGWKEEEDSKQYSSRLIFCAGGSLFKEDSRGYVGLLQSWDKGQVGELRLTWKKQLSRAFLK